MSFQPKMLKSFKKAKSEFKRDYDSTLKYRVDGLFDSLVGDLQTQLTDSPSSVLVPSGAGNSDSSQSLSHDAENEELARELFGDDDEYNEAPIEGDAPIFTELDWSTYLESTAAAAVKVDEAVPSSDDDDDDDGGIQFVSTRQQYTFSCPFTGCWAAFTSNRQLAEHKKSLHLTMAQPAAQQPQATPPVQGEKRKRDPTNYECPFAGCGKLFRSTQERLNHARVHTGARPYHCIWKHCSYKARQLGHVTTHVRIVHFGLPKSQKEQQEKGIVDDRDPRDFIRFNTKVDSQHD